MSKSPNSQSGPRIPGTTTNLNSDPLTWSTPQGRWTLDFARPLVMGIINITPDSFSDGGRYFDPAEAVRGALTAEAEGADLFDLGAESTRPGSDPVAGDDEWARLEPVLKSLTSQSRRPISIDTYKAGVAEKALLAGAAIINDIYADRFEPDILKVAADYRVPIILMHMLGEPRTMQKEPRYDDVVKEVHDFLLERAGAAEKAGVPRELIWLDPGIGFGKNIEHNLLLIKHFDRALPRGYRRVMALSRKAFLGRLMNGAQPLERDGLTAAANSLAVMSGAEILRVHRVGPTRAAADLAQAVLTAR